MTPLVLHVFAEPFFTLLVTTRDYPEPFYFVPELHTLLSLPLLARRLW